MPHPLFKVLKYSNEITFNQLVRNGYLDKEDKGKTTMPGKTENSGQMKGTKQSGFEFRLLIQYRLSYIGKPE